ncbi:MAG: fatty acid desaturase [Myxococcales bacterium]|nr:fatty acid desaturase [Myxococcales bacterium]MCB9732494.1 fatty acid desaturase [Deltaproteobacteria bacterium]
MQARRTEAQVGDAAPRMAVVGSRTGSELNQATRPYAEEDRAKSWRLLFVTVGLWAAALVGTAVAPWWPLKLVLSVFAGLVAIRWFIFYHDYLHTAILQDSKLASAIFGVCGFYTLAVRSVWRETHNYHHKNNAKLVGSAIGSYPVLTIGMWRSLTPAQRRLYKTIRHPLFIFFGYFTVFMIGMTFSPAKRDMKKHWGGPLAVALHIGAFVALGLLAGWVTAFFVVSFPLIVALGAGSYLFFAQHNFPEMQLKDRRGWDYTFAALRSSSYFVMNPVMHWFTGNIGYHHVHHLNHRIPFYRLPEAMAAIPELQDPGRTTWKLSDIVANLKLAVWDPEENRMLTYKELEAKS